MFSNMFKIAWRNALRQKQFSVLNILGLSLGLTATLLIGLYIQDELKYDKHFVDANRIYRINMPMIWGDWEESFSSTPPNVAVAIREDIPEFEHITRLHKPDVRFLAYDDESGNRIQFKENELFAADISFFNVFSFEFTAGNAESSFSAPGQVLLTEETAQRYFGEEDAVGKTIKIVEGENKGNLIVSGILKDVPDESHIQFNMLVTMNTFPVIQQREWTWIWTTFGTYGKLSAEANPIAVEDKLQALPPKWSATTMQRVFQQTYEEYIGDNTWFLEMQPLTEAYLYCPPSGNRFGPAGNIQSVRIFGAVGVLVLLLSCINFMNLATARSTKRAKEVGVRKVLGSYKHQLISQFLFESVLFVLVSMVLAVVFTEFAMSAFNTIADKELSLYTQLTNPLIGMVLIGFSLILGTLAGSYPAFYLSAIRPISMLKGKAAQGFKAKALRNGLVVFQFTISVALILTTVFVQKQLAYTSKMDVGYDRDNLIHLDNMELLSGSLDPLKNALESFPEIEQVALSDLTPPYISNEDKYVADEPDMPTVTLNRLLADEDYLDLLGTEFLLGRNFDETRPADAQTAIINLAAVKALGWTLDDLQKATEAKHITFPWSDNLKFEVIGVLEDFNFNSLRFDIRPLIILNAKNDQVWQDGTRTLSVRVNSSSVNNSDELNSLLNKIESEMSQIDESVPFEYSFLDQEFEDTFRTEQRMGNVLNIFTMMAIAIACLGLFGLAAFTAEQRKKELGVRKVLGASVSSLMRLFTQEFTQLVLVAIIIASPLTYFFVKNWLADFAYTTPIEIWVFLVAGVGALLIALLTIGAQSLKAASQNPVNVLRNE